MAAKKVARPPHKSPAKAPEQKAGTGGKNGNKPFDNKNRGALFTNDKDGNEKRPDMTGILDLEIPEDAEPGTVVKFRLAAWEREDRNGNPYLSMTIQKADKQGSNQKKKSDEEDESGDE